MASNDMNSWDDDPDELLRRHWQRAFDDFEVQPRSSLSRHILNQLPAGRRRRPVRWLAAGLLLFITAGLLYQVRFSERPDIGDKNKIVQSVSPNHRRPNSHTPQPTASAERPLSPEPAKISLRSDEVTASQRPTVHQPSASRIETSDVSALRVATPQVETGSNFLSGAKELIKSTATTEKRIAGQSPLRNKTKKTSRATSISAGQLLSESFRSASSRFPTQPSDLVRSDRFEPVQFLMDESANQRTLSTPQMIANESPVRSLQPLKFGGYLPLTSHLSGLPNQLPALGSVGQSLVENAVVRPTQRWFIDVAPLSSFQWMSALPASVGYLSQVHGPAAFSPATWGYQLNGGIRFQRWQVYLSIGQLRRWAYYTVNENRYRVEPSPANPHHLVRDSYTVAENVALPMVGTGLSQYKLLFQGRYVAELGGQVSYLPTSRQTLLGLRGGLSRRLLLSHRMELQAGVTVEYGLNRLLSEQRQLAIHPVVVGLGVRIQPRLERP